MKCLFCAEEIKEDAIVCRFCGAVKEDGEWKPPRAPGGAAEDSALKGRFTIRTAGVLFLASAVLEIASATSDVPLFGAVRGGVVAVLYHLVYTGLYVALGVGLLVGRRWGYRLVFVATLYYTLDRALYLLDRKTMEVHLAQQLKPYAEMLEMIDQESILRLTASTTVLFAACWWGFALYIHMRRGYFRP